MNKQPPQAFQAGHRAALMAACRRRSVDRSALTSSTRMPGLGSSSAAPSSSTSIWRLSTW
ncbi:hypothetical protein I553_2562 [Mycobacterium xenopi 4042]|uniref:Uncharacterized protein n=1 Tax=Mycobacterium xenopi 4042 TaxID=1299334 RepID=X8CAM8_MYCXE|nr:hypothetical protein I553_2562 [Mycobacterium xenopi 4042]